jgi:hypothetical protein
LLLLIHTVDSLDSASVALRYDLFAKVPLFFRPELLWRLQQQLALYWILFLDIAAQKWTSGILQAFLG